MKYRRYLLGLLVLFAGTALWAVAEPTAEELEQNRRKLDGLRKHPEQLARLRDNLKAFLELSETKQGAILKLDHDLSEAPAAKQAKLWSALERYADWLDQLRKSDPQAYQAIKDAADGATRLALVKEQRDREWMETLPKAQRVEWTNLKGAARAAFVAKLRAEERTKHEQWIVAKRFWKELHDPKKEMPCRLSDFTSDKVKTYVSEYLMPFLTAEEKKQLDSTAGRWPDYPQALVEVASKHPSALPPPRVESLPKHLSELPKPVRDRVSEKKTDKGKSKLLQKLIPYDGRPNFATKVVEFGTKEGKQPFEFEFWASNHRSLLAPMKDFVDNKLTPVLKDSEKKQLSDIEGHWPLYPQTIQELASKHNLQPPWHILPEPDRWKWDLYRPSRGKETAN